VDKQKVQRVGGGLMAAAAGSDDMRGEDGVVYHRDNIFEFFRNHTAYDMLPESGKVSH
jgi:predicted transcriptional regulator